MASARPRPHLDLEITVVSAKHIKNVNWRNGDLKPYAVAYLDPDRRSATKPDDSGSTRPVWNERLTLPLPIVDADPSPPLLLSLEIFHSKPSETPKPLVGSACVPLRDLIDLADLSAGPTPIRTLELRRPSGRPQGRVRIKLALRERPMPPPPAPFEQPGYHMAPPPPPPSTAPSAYYYSTAPPPPMPARDYSTYSPSQPPPHYSGGYSAPYSGYYTAGAGYYSAPAALPPVRPVYYSPPADYGRPSAPMDYSTSSYEQHPQQRAKGGGRMGMGAGLAVGAVAGALGALALEEGIKHEEEKIADRVESDLAARDDYSDYHGDY